MAFQKACHWRQLCFRPDLSVWEKVPSDLCPFSRRWQHGGQEVAPMTDQRNPAGRWLELSSRVSTSCHCSSPPFPQIQRHRGRAQSGDPVPSISSQRNNPHPGPEPLGEAAWHYAKSLRFGTWQPWNQTEICDPLQDTAILSHRAPLLRTALSIQHKALTTN